jgi:cytosine/adenosine deaminase-related metal-dependent hydrolase
MAYIKFRGDYLFTGTALLDSNYVLITNKAGKVKGVVPLSEAGDNVQKFEGILCPGFINCHCHLELSHLKGLIPEHTGLVPFVLSILKQRNNYEINEFHAKFGAMGMAEQEMSQCGIVAVGDICNTRDTVIQKEISKLQFYNFIEVSGFQPQLAEYRYVLIEETYELFKKYFPNHTSLVPHAPYSVSKELFGFIDNLENNDLISIHNQETPDENEFFLNGEGQFNLLYETLGVDIKQFHKPSGNTSLQTVLPYISKPKKLLLVHDTFTSQSDIDVLKAMSPTQQAIFCLCVNANLYIENKLPPIDLFFQNGCEIVLGTDSLASNHQLSILSEMATITQNFPHIPLQSILQWATLNGAKALNMDDNLGSFEAGKKPGIVNITNLSKEGSLTKESKAKRIL